MALIDTINTIIARAKVDEICDTLHDVQNSSTEDELIEAALPLAVYAYQSGIVDDALLGDLTEANLNAHNIYTTGSFTLTNPDAEVYIMKDAVVTLVMSGSNYVKVNVLGGGTLHLTAGDTSYVTVKVYDSAIVTVEINDDAMVNLTASELSTPSIILNDNSICHITGRDNVVIAVESNDTSYCLAKMFSDSEIDATVSGTSAIDISLFQNAKEVLS